MARVLGAKGLKGGVRVELLTDWPERVVAGAEVWLDGASDPVRIDRVESGGRIPVVYLQDVTTRDGATALTGRYLESRAGALPPETYWWDDLVGLRVEEPEGTLVGELVEVFRTGGSEVYRVVGPAGERMVPALRSTVLKIDLDAGLMVIAPDDAEEVR